MIAVIFFCLFVGLVTSHPFDPALSASTPSVSECRQHNPGVEKFCRFDQPSCDLKDCAKFCAKLYFDQNKCDGIHCCCSCK
ncbi:hypothetical protein Ddc_12005 [Ditylenchus destructor]|nr:hypothetical protein Ddc_12005 [Ditylenchus destructor]